jgi:tRNA-dihydrouridine synthase C
MTLPIPAAIRLLLAPMEGLLDHRLRDVLTRVGGLDRCVSEFIRVTDRRVPDHVLLRLVPELRHGSRTAAGTPVRPQLLGSDPGCLADNAAALAALGAEGVDLNFGCPARTVNRHRGGAVLLDEPELLRAIVAAVRAAVPAGLPVSAKMRLGYRDESRLLDCARALADGGAGEIVVHARTQADGYRPPARWDRIALVREAVAVPVVANGELWTTDDARRCLAESGCGALMLGRGLVADPGLALAIRRSLGGDGGGDGGDGDSLAWEDLLPHIRAFWDGLAGDFAERHRPGRLKQWLNLLRRRFPAAQAAWEQVREVGDSGEVERRLFPRGA